MSYLRTCLEDFAEITDLKYRRGQFNLSAIEADVRHLRDSRQPLSVESLAYFTKREHWWFENFWVLPSKEHIEMELEQRSFDFWNLPKREEEVITELFAVFRSIEHVSIILRFVRPDHYGILSPPVERMLEVRRSGKAVETYRSYLGDLRAIRDNRIYGLTRAADADMALWVLHERCFGRHQRREIQEAFEADAFMLQLRARNLVLPLRDLPVSRLALALSELRPDLAGLIACHQLEIKIRDACEHFRVTTENDPDSDRLETAMNVLALVWSYAAHRLPIWQHLRVLRNDVVHHGRTLKRRDLDELLRELSMLEAELGRVRRDQGKTR